MRLSENDLSLLAQCAIAAALQAGLLIARHALRPIAVESKDGGASLAAQAVTEADRASQDLILRALLPTCERFDIAMLSEESPDDRSRLRRDFFWSVDPLDGTLPFVEGVPGYSVSIALVSREGVPLIGTVYDPVAQTLYHAVKDRGIWRNGRAFEPEPARKDSLLIFVTDKSFAEDPLYAPTLVELETIAAELGYPGATLNLQGGAAMNACLALDRPGSCYFKFPKPQKGGGSVWDYAATACLFREAGLPASDIEGRPFDLNPTGSTFMNRCGVLYCSDRAIAERTMRAYRTLSRP